MSLKEQIKLFSNAKTIVAPHGAGLTNIIFAPKNAIVLEFFHKSYKNQCFRSLAKQVGIKYNFLIDAKTISVKNQLGNQNMFILLKDLKQFFKEKNETI